MAMQKTFIYRVLLMTTYTDYTAVIIADDRVKAQVLFDKSLKEHTGSESGYTVAEVTKIGTAGKGADEGVICFEESPVKL